MAFNNQFEIKTSDDQLAFYILTPQFMESIMRLDELADGYTNIEFRDTSVVVTLNNGRDSFEVKKYSEVREGLKSIDRVSRRNWRLFLECLMRYLPRIICFEIFFVFLV